MYQQGVPVDGNCERPVRRTVRGDCHGGILAIGLFARRQQLRSSSVVIHRKQMPDRGDEAGPPLLAHSPAVLFGQGQCVRERGCAVVVLAATSSHVAYAGFVLAV